MTYQPSEIADLILMLALGPVIVVAVRRIMPHFPAAGGFALAAMLGAYIFTIAEGYAFPDLFNVIEHVCYAIAGWAFVVMLIQMKDWLARRGGQPR